ncbi:hypothetical protein BGX29_004529, partial [Mortierella sp. GBA35]
MSTPKSINNNELPLIQDLALNATAAFTVAPKAAPVSEDVDMDEQQHGTTPSSSTEQPPAVTTQHDLSQFSVFYDDSDSDTDSNLTDNLQEVLITKRNNLAAWTKAYHQTLLKLETNGREHPQYATWLKECTELERIVCQKTDEHARFAAALSLGQPKASTTTSPTSATATVATSDSKKLTLDSGTPRFGDAKLGKGQTYRVIPDPHLFLDSFKTYCENSYGEAPFLASAQRLLCMAIQDEQTRQQFNDELTHHGSSSLTWEECEVAFVDSVLTPKERFDTVARVAEIGRRSKESYRNFALRLQRSVRVYRIDDGNTTVLSGILRSMPSLELNLIKGAIQKAGTSLFEVKMDSINEILSVISAMEGPDDSLKRQHHL